MLKDVRHKSASNSTISGLLTATGTHFLRHPGSLPRLRDTVATFLFAGRTRSEFQYISQRHTHIHMCRTVAWPATQAVTDKALPSPNPLLLGWQKPDFTDTGIRIEFSGCTDT